MEPNATRFPFPLPSRTIGEQKAKVKKFFFVAQALLPVFFLCIHLAGIRSGQTRTGRSACATCARSTTANLLVLLPDRPLQDFARYTCGYVLLLRNLLPSDRKIHPAKTPCRFAPESGLHSAR